MGNTESAPHTSAITSDPEVQILPLASYMLPYKEQSTLQVSPVPPLWS